MQPIPHYAFCAPHGHHAKRYIAILVRFQRQRENPRERWGSIDTFRTQQALSYGFGCASGRLLIDASRDFPSNQMRATCGELWSKRQRTAKRTRSVKDTSAWTHFIYP